jgi:pyruvate/2-oxoglutarate dehydrogenase complex dihydrolipoamide dehydrogenase (E3) component
MFMYDVLVLGGGPAGVTAALRARELGAKTALVEEGHFGGTCTNDGCVPTRVLAKAARLLRDAQQSSMYGIEISGEPRVNFPETLRRTREVVEEVRKNKHLSQHLEDVGVEVFEGAGPAVFDGAKAVKTGDGRRLESERFIIAVGGHPKKLPIEGAEHALSPNDVWDMPELPKSAVVIGAGSTGSQIASAFHTFGVETTLMDIMPTILPAEDEEVAETVQEGFAELGMQVLTELKGVSRIVNEGGGPKHLSYEDAGGHEQEIRTDAVVMATGWAGGAEELGLEEIGVNARKSFIIVDEQMKTSKPHVFAAGDVIGKTMLVQNAANQARIAAENAVLGRATTAESSRVAHGGFTDPEYGGVGLTQSQAEAEHDAVTARVSFRSLDRAIIDGRTFGFFKLIADRDTHQVLGAHCVGEQSVEIVEMIAGGMTSDVRVEQLANLELAYPTYMAIVGLAARDIVRRLGTLPISQEWRTMAEATNQAAEWERTAHE